jgi:DNA-binding XRE family transcriptional regulator
MRRSPQRHTLAVLRILVGLTQKEMAAMLNYSKPTIQAIELGKLQMSEKLAGLTALKTGINLAWLLDNKTSKPPIDHHGKPYTIDTFENAQASINVIKTDGIIGHDAASLCARVNLERLLALILRAYKNDDVALCAYKLAKTFDKLEAEYGVTDEDRNAVALETSMKIALETCRLVDAYIMAKPQDLNSAFGEKKLKLNESDKLGLAVGHGVSFGGFSHAVFEATKKKKGVVQYPARYEFLFSSPGSQFETKKGADGQLYVKVSKEKPAQTKKNRR